ncbi:hypothetical protein ACFCV3_01030 [Kribbella sp. NPDC056345]
MGESDGVLFFGCDRVEHGCDFVGFGLFELQCAEVFCDRTLDSLDM